MAFKNWNSATSSASRSAPGMFRMMSSGKFLRGKYHTEMGRTSIVGNRRINFPSSGLLSLQRSQRSSDEMTLHNYSSCNKTWKGLISQRRDLSSEQFRRQQSKILSDMMEKTTARLTSIRPMRRDYIELWGRPQFWGSAILFNTMAAAAFTAGQPAYVFLPGIVWTYVGIRDLNSLKTLRRNFPVLCRIRYGLESIRPELRQYFFETELEESPISRKARNLIYQRAKKRGESNPLGTRNDYYETGYEWVNHSNLGARHLDVKAIERVLIGGGSDVEQYNCSRLNISGMSYGALSHAAVKALNWGAKMGGFYHNTGEGGVSEHHKHASADLVWNVGTGYFGCRDMETGRFCEERFLETLATTPSIKMIELKLSQGAKPGHGGIMPAAKLTQEIADIRGVPFGRDVLSPPWHSEFSGPDGMMQFLSRLRRLSRKPVGFKMCVGNQHEVAAIVHAMRKEFSRGNRPLDFITIDGGEGGTGAAPVEFSDRVGFPLREGLILVDDLLRGAGIRHEIKIICSGKILYGFSMVRAHALGADVCAAARGFMFSLGCIQALKCNSNHCPTGITTTDEELIVALDIPSKAIRVKNFHESTMLAFTEMVGACGVDSPDYLSRSHIMKRVGQHHLSSYEDFYPTPANGSLLDGTAPEKLQRIWDSSEKWCDNIYLDKSSGSSAW